jgi:hypothetical protein
MIPFGGTVLSRGVTRHMFTCACLIHTWREALSCSVWSDSQVYMFTLGLILLGHQEPVKGLEVQAHHLTSLGMNCIVLWPVWPPRTIKCNTTNNVVNLGCLRPAPEDQSSNLGAYGRHVASDNHLVSLCLGCVERYEAAHNPRSEGAGVLQCPLPLACRRASCVVLHKALLLCRQACEELRLACGQSISNPAQFCFIRSRIGWDPDSRDAMPNPGSLGSKHCLDDLFGGKYLCTSEGCDAPEQHKNKHTHASTVFLGQRCCIARKLEHG